MDANGSAADRRIGIKWVVIELEAVPSRSLLTQRTGMISPVDFRVLYSTVVSMMNLSVPRDARALTKSANGKKLSTKPVQ